MSTEKKSKEIKNTSFKLLDCKASEDGKTGFVTGYPAVFNNLDDWNDIIRQGAFVETIKRNLHWKILRFHFTNRPIGVNKEAKEDNIGLLTVAAIALDSQDGSDQFALSKLSLDVGGKDARSIGFLAEEYTYKKQHDSDSEYRELTKIDLWEDSFVTWGANDQAMSTDIKTRMGLDQDFGMKNNVDRFFRFMEDLGYRHTEVKDFLLKGEQEKKELQQLAATAREAKSLFTK